MALRRRLVPLLAWLGVVAPAAAAPPLDGDPLVRLYKVTLGRADIGRPPAGGTWDAPAAASARTLPGSSCCHGQGIPDGVDPDVQVIVSQGPRRFVSRVRFDQLHPTFDETAYFALSVADGPLSIAVVDQDGDRGQPIGQTTFAAPTGGSGPAALRFGAVERLEVTATSVPGAVESFVVDAAVGNLDTSLYLPAGQLARLTAEGAVCAGKICGAADGRGRLATPTPAGLLGSLSVVLGDADHRRSERFSPDRFYRADTGGYLGLDLVSAPETPLRGTYRVTIRLLP